MKSPASRSIPKKPLRTPALVSASNPNITMSSSELVLIARETRRNAEAFARTVRRFGQEMPDHLDRFHEAMMAFRTTARALRS